MFNVWDRLKCFFTDQRKWKNSSSQRLKTGLLNVFGETWPSAGQKQPERLVEHDASETERLQQENTLMQQIKYRGTLR